MEKSYYPFRCLGTSKIYYSSVVSELFIIICLCAISSSLYAKKKMNNLQKIENLKQQIPFAKDTALVNLYDELTKLHCGHRLPIDSTLKYFELTKKLAIETNHQRVLDVILLRQAMVQHRAGKFTDAVKSVKKYIAIAESKRDTGHLLNARAALSYVYFAAGDVENTLKATHQALELSISREDKFHRPLLYNRIGLVYSKQSEYKKAIDFFRKAREHSTVIKFANTLYSNLASNFMKLNQLDSAAHYAYELLHTAESGKYLAGIHDAYALLSEINIREKNYDKVIALTNSLPTSQPSADYEAYLGTLGNRAKAFCALGNFGNALKLGKQISTLSENCKSIYCSEIEAEVNYFIHKQSGNYQESTAYLEKYLSIRDSIINEKKELNLQNLQALYEDEKKERELLELNQANQQQAYKLKKRSHSILVLLFIGVLIGFIFYFYTQQRSTKNLQQKSEMEQRLLRLQMNPHFIFNALFAIQTYLIQDRQPLRAAQYLSQFSDLMRRILEYSRATYITLEEELDTLENYLELQQIRYQNSFQYHIEVEENLDSWELLVPPLMIQPFIENAIEHSQVQTMEDGCIEIIFKRKENDLLIIIKDNGIGRTRSMAIEGKKDYKSLSTKITHERIKILSRLNKRPFFFEIEDLPTRGTQVLFQFPIITDL